MVTYVNNRREAKLRLKLIGCLKVLLLLVGNVASWRDLPPHQQSSESDSLLVLVLAASG
jgi:hypothetical protein